MDRSLMESLRTIAFLITNDIENLEPLMESLVKIGSNKTSEDIDNLFQQNKNFLTVSPNCSARQFRAIIQDQTEVVKKKISIEGQNSLSFSSKKKKKNSQWDVIDDNQTQENFYDLFKKDFNNVDSLVYYLCQLNGDISQFFNKLNQDIKRKYFNSDIEKQTLSQSKFWDIFNKFRSQQNSENFDIQNPSKISFGQWKKLKKSIAAQKFLNPIDCENIYDQKLKTKQIVVFHEQCQKFHKAEILNDNPEDFKALFKNQGDCQMGDIQIQNISCLQSIKSPQTFRKRTNNDAVNFIKNVDVKALAILIKLLELKYFFIEELTKTVKNEELTDEQIQNDTQYYKKNVSIIDKYLKNALLKLRIRDAQEFGNLKRRKRYLKKLCICCIWYQK